MPIASTDMLQHIVMPKRREMTHLPLPGEMPPTGSLKRGVRPSREETSSAAIPKLLGANTRRISISRSISRSIRRSLTCGATQTTRATRNTRNIRTRESWKSHKSQERRGDPGALLEKALTKRRGLDPSSCPSDELTSANELASSRKIKERNQIEVWPTNTKHAPPRWSSTAVSQLGLEPSFFPTKMDLRQPETSAAVMLNVECMYEDSDSVVLQVATWDTPRPSSRNLKDIKGKSSTKLTKLSVGSGENRRPDVVEGFQGLVQEVSKAPGSSCRGTTLTMRRRNWEMTIPGLSQLE